MFTVIIDKGRDQEFLDHFKAFARQRRATAGNQDAPARPTPQGPNGFGRLVYLACSQDFVDYLDTVSFPHQYYKPVAPLGR
jgi:hypothetical protein